MLSEIADLFLKNRTKQENFIHLYPVPGNCGISPLMNKILKNQFLSPTAGPERMTPRHFIISLWTNGAFTPQYMSLGNLFIVILIATKRDIPMVT